MLLSSSLGWCTPRGAERVAGEVGELDEQLAGPHRIGADERGDRGERVVDEVRRDLRAQRHLGRLSRARDSSSSASSSWLDTYRATSPVARSSTGPAVWLVSAASVPTIEPSISSGCTTMPRISQSTRSHWMLLCESTCCARCGSPRRPARRRPARGGRPRRPRPARRRGCRSSPAPGCRAACAGRAGRRRPTTARALAQRGRGEGDGVQGAEGRLLQRRRERVAPAADDQDDHDRRQHRRRRRAAPAAGATRAVPPRLLPHEAGQPAVGERPATGLTAGTVLERPIGEGHLRVPHTGQGRPVRA